MADGPTYPRLLLGSDLRDFRRSLGLTGQDVATAMSTKYSSWKHTSKLYRIEAGQQGIKPEQLADILDLYQVHDPADRERLMTLGAQGNIRGWWAPFRSAMTEQHSAYVGYELDACEVCCLHTMIWDGLLQTEAYATRVIRSSGPNLGPADVAALVKVRLTRQALLAPDRMPEPLRFNGVFSEAVLRQRIGGGDVTREQLEHVLKMAHRPNVSIRIIPFTRGVFPGMVGAFSVVTFPDQAVPPVVYEEALSGDVFPPLDEIGRYIVAWQQLQGVALDRMGSITMIEEALNELTTN